jgi:uncharacterized protein (TIGR02996 family)
MRAFRYTDETSAKFWNIELKGNQFTVTFGRLGSQGQTQTKKFADAAKAKAEHDKLIREKLGKRYIETTAAAPTEAGSTTENALEKALLEDPDDLATHSAYADFLAEQGDPRGELIQVQLALEDPKRPVKERKELHKREAALLKKHAREWLGDLAPYLLDQEGLSDYERKSGNVNSYQFSRGWLDTVSFRDMTVAIARKLAHAPQARLLRRLTIEVTAYEEPGQYEPGPDVPAESDTPATLHPLLRSPYLGNIRYFQLGEQYEDGQYGGASCHTYGDTAVDLIEKMPKLEELYLMAHGVDTNRLFNLKTLTHLRVLEVDHLHKYPFDRLAKNPAFAQLATLRCHPHGLDEEEAYIRLDGLRAILRSPHLKKLTHVRLCLSDAGDDGCEEIVRSGALKRLKVLDLSHGRITDDGARTLVDCPDLKNLEVLNVSYNGLTDAGVRQLRTAGIQVVAKDQFSQSEIEEGQYLYGGDPE